MKRKLKTLWINDGLLDQDMHLSQRRQVLKALNDQHVEVRANFDYLRNSIYIEGLDKVWLLKCGMKGIPGTIILFAKKVMILWKNLDVDIVVVTPFNIHTILPIWFLWSKILGQKSPKFVIDIRTLNVDLQNNWKGELRDYRFESGIRFAYRYFDGITIITEKMKKDLQKNHKSYKKEICVWSSGVDPIVFNPDNVKDLRNELGFKDRFVIMYHGFLSPNRGLQQAIKAISLVKKSYPEVMLFLLGKGPVKNEIKKMVRELNLSENVLIHEPVPLEEVPKYIKSSQVGILPFPNLDWWNTSSPIKLFEYLAMKKPVLVTDIEAHRNVLGGKECGFFVNNHDPNSLAQGISGIIDKKTEIKELGKIARETALKYYTWEKQAQKIKSYFQKLLE